MEFGRTTTLLQILSLSKQVKGQTALVDQIEAMNKQSKSKLKRAGEAAGTDHPPEKRTRMDLSAEGASASRPESNIIQFSESTKQHVEDFFSKDATSQREILRAMLTDQRIKTVLPPSSSVEPHSAEMATSNLSYNNQSIDFTDPASFRPIDKTAFHWYPPHQNNGIHRSLHQINASKEDYDVNESAKKSLNHHANLIKNYVMNLSLTDEQRRSAFWKSLSLPGLSDMVKSFGFSTDDTNTALLIAKNVQRFIEQCRSKGGRYL